MGGPNVELHYTPAPSSNRQTLQVGTMFRLALRSVRIRPHRRPRRPPDPTIPNVRFFARNSQLLRLSAYPPRPQLPFLPAKSHRASQWRWLTTQKREQYKEQAWIITKTSAATWAILISLSIVCYGVVQSALEGEHPTPAEWSFWTRTKFRSAMGQQKEAATPSGLVDWALVGSLYRQVLRRLEDPRTDGAGLAEQEEGGIDIPGAGRAGLDTDGKSEAWRQGYYETLMGCAKAAEHLDGMLVDRTTSMVTKAHYVIGPSNPEPKPLPPWQYYAPLEENCEPASPPPEQYYVQILTTKGFTPKQRLDAAIAYADWLDFKQLHGTAEEMLKWARDIAESSSQAQPVFDASYRPSSLKVSPVSDNQLTAMTALATHYASTGKLSEALSLYLAALQQRKAAPLVASSESAQSTRPRQPTTDIEALGRWWHSFLTLIGDPPYTVAPGASYDEPLVKHPGDGSVCEEAKLEVYIGEILFATATSGKGRADAITWTRDAIEKADLPTQDKQLPLDKRLKCLSCMEVGLSNWISMARQMADDERQGKLPASNGTSGWVPRSWRRRFGYVTAPAQKDEEGIAGRWQLEEKDAEKRRAQFNREALREKLTISPFAPFWARVGWLMKG